MNSLFLFFVSALLCWSLTYLLLLFFRFMKIGQNVREEGPFAHKEKNGTPTMAGIAIILTIAIMASIFIDLDGRLIALILLMSGFAIVGFMDDFIKVSTEKNLGFLPWQKMFLQIVIALAFASYMVLIGNESGVRGLLEIIRVNIAWIYLPFVMIMIIAASNAANLTDGLDGLLGGCAIAAFAAFAYISYQKFFYDIAALCLIVIAALTAFLFFNFKPAKIFMGDVGSLGLGALLAGIAVLIHKELLLVLIGGVFVLEALSVIIQVASFKMTGKRVFKMSPLHHHFELSGMKEINVVFMFWAAAAFCGVMGVLIR